MSKLGWWCVVREYPIRILEEEADEVIVGRCYRRNPRRKIISGKNLRSRKRSNNLLNNFFRRRNLIALRELALRQSGRYGEEEASNSTFIGQSCPVHERVLVCVSTYPNSLRLLRRGAVG
ncbi:MAG UNVERIFIED_CONTAM: hypothetical protein LVR29_03450 [Microcystis novacekii LVE1205-3]